MVPLVLVSERDRQCINVNLLKIILEFLHAPYGFVKLQLGMGVLLFKQIFMLHYLNNI